MAVDNSTPAPGPDATTEVAPATVTPAGQLGANPLRWRVLAVLSLMQFLIVTDNTIVNVALPAIRRDLHFAASGLAWVVDGYMLAAGGLLLLGGRIGDRVGYRRMFLAGTWTFGLASVASGVSISPTMLVISRFAQGVGEAMAAPAALALIAVLFTGADRAKALGVWGGLAGLGATVGVLLSGVLVEWASWRWVFLINIPFVACAIVALPRVIGPDDRRRWAKARVDVAGAILITAGLTLAVAGLLRVAAHGWGDAGTLSMFAVAVGCLAAFALVESRTVQPLVPFGFLRHRTRVAANVVSALLGGAMAGMFVLLTLYQQSVVHYSPLRTGLAYLPFCLAFVPGFAVAAVTMKRWGTRVTLVAAFVMCVAGMVLMSRITATSDYVGVMLPAMVVLAVGLGMAFPAAQNAALAETTEESTGLASGVQTTAQALGAALGVAALVTVAAAHTPAPELAASIVHGDRVAFLTAAGMYLLAALIAGVAVREPHDPEQEPAADVLSRTAADGPAATAPTGADADVSFLHGPHDR